MFDEERDYELNARYDYMREAYGDPCPGCGTLRGGGDCPRCYVEFDDDDAAVVAPSVQTRPVLDAPALDAPALDTTLVDDDIPF